MTHTLRLTLASAVTAAALLFAATASATMLNLSYDPMDGIGGLNGMNNPDPHFYDSGNLLSGSVNLMENNEFWIDFDNNKHIEWVTDGEPSEVRLTFNITAAGTHDVEEGGQVEFTGVMGEAPTLSGGFMATGDGCSFGAGLCTLFIGLPLGDIEFLFHDIHFEFPFKPGTGTTIDSLSFQLTTVVDGFIEVGVWEMPEPGTLAIFGLGLVGLGFARRKKKAA